MRVVLIAGSERVDLELAAELAAVRGEALGVDAEQVAVLAVRRPGLDESAIGECRDRGIILEAGRGGVDLELAADLAAIGRKVLGEDGRKS